MSDELTDSRRGASRPAQAPRMTPAGAMGPPQRAGDTTVRSVKDLHSERTVVHLARNLTSGRRVDAAGQPSVPCDTMSRL